ncbi:glycosyltransferase family 2 protein [Marmoricola sp. RAF53]|uniref:glycosyltransferase family 2 protein n=1 Tax=Marmoricola sp. RAF53 TaxID=3233059 RepID=UPI003F9CC6B8
MYSTELIGRSRPFRGGRKALALLSVAVFLGYVLWSQIAWGFATATIYLSTFFGLVAVMILCYLASGIFWKSFTHLPPATGRVLALVPSYNEEPHLVHAVIRSMLRQTILPDAIHVVDDGSAVPLETFDDPLVTWHRIENSGKRHAQAHVLKMFKPTEFDYIFTVDSDSVLDDDALEHMLRSMRDERVQAATGMILVRNWDANFLSRLTDINVVTSCLLFRMLRSWMGIVSPTSGALAIYRAAVVYDNLEDYLTSGTAGDDRRLSFYALMRGDVVGVTEAIAATQLPTTWGGAFHQRLRWSKSAWLGVGFVMTNLRPLIVFFYVMPLVFTFLWPFVAGALITLAIKYDNPVFMHGVVWWIVCSITQTAVYAIYRPSFDLKTRLQQFALSPIYPILGLVILRPAAYWALTKLKSTSWHTREVAPVDLGAATPIDLDAELDEVTGHQPKHARGTGPH